MNTKQVMEAFIEGKHGKANSVYTNTHHGKDEAIEVVYSYGRHFPLAIRQAGKLFVNSDKYSQTTSKHQSYLRQAIGQEDYELRTTEELSKMIDSVIYA